MLPCFLHRLQQILRDVVLGSADDGIRVGLADAVDIVADSEHMGGRNRHGAQLMQSHHREPIFIVPLQHQHHPHTPTDSGIPEHICHAVGILLDVPERKKVLLILGVAPDQSGFLRGLRGNGIHHIVAKVKILRVGKLQSFQSAPVIQGFPAEFAINTHTVSFISPILRKRS